MRHLIIGRDVSPSRVAGITRAIRADHESGCVVTPQAIAIVGPSVNGSFVVTPQTVCLLRYLIERIVLIALAIWTGRCTAVGAIDEVARLRTGIGFSRPRDMIVSEG